MYNACVCIHILDIKVDNPFRDEIVKAIKSWKNVKALGQENLNAELFKAEPELAADVLAPVFKAVWRDGGGDTRAMDKRGDHQDSKERSAQ